MVVRLSTWSIDGHSSGSTSRALIDVHSQLSSRSMQRSLVYSRQLGQRFRDITVGLLLLRFTSRRDGTVTMRDARIVLVSSVLHVTG